MGSGIPAWHSDVLHWNIQSWANNPYVCRQCGEVASKHYWVTRLFSRHIYLRCPAERTLLWGEPWHEYAEKRLRAVSDMVLAVERVVRAHRRLQSDGVQ